MNPAQQKSRKTILVAGYLRVAPGDRKKLLELSRPVVELARAQAKCLDFAVSPDLIDTGRVNIFERWTSRAALNAFRESGPDDGMDALVQSFHIEEFEV